MRPAPGGSPVIASKALAGLAALLAASAVGCARDGSREPDLSGAYTLDVAKSRFGLEAARAIESGSLSVEHRGRRFRFSRVFRAGGTEHPLTLDLAIDGHESEHEIDGRTIRTRLHWDRDELVAESRIAGPDGEASNVVRYRLLEGGAILEASERFRGPALRYDNVWVFRRTQEH